MARYVDISVNDGIGAMDGSNVDNYMGWNQFMTSVLVGSDIDLQFTNAGQYYLRGSRVVDRNVLNWTWFNINGPIVELLPWDAFAYGPWRMNFNNGGCIIYNVETISGGIIHAPIEVWIERAAASTYLDLKILNSVLMTDNQASNSWVGFDKWGLSNTSNQNISVGGSLLIGYEIGVWSENASSTNNLSITDSFLICNSLLDYGVGPTNIQGMNVISSDHTAFTCTPIVGTHTNQQFDVPVPVIPAWDGSSQDWSIAVLNTNITISGSGAYTGYETDLWGTPRITIGTGYMKAPVWEATYPKSALVTSITADILVKTVEDSTAYFVVLPFGATAPSSAQVKAGTDSNNIPVITGFSGNKALISNIEETLSVTGLTPLISYDIYVVAEDSLNLQLLPTLIQVTTIDISSPEWITGYPNVVTVGLHTAQVSLKVNEAAKAYYVVLPNGSPAPSSIQVKNGRDSNNIPVDIIGNVVLAANTENIVIITGLTPETQNDFYVVVEDLVFNLQNVPVQLDIDTFDTVDPDWTLTYPSLDNVTINTANVLVSLNEDGIVYGVVLPKGSIAPTSAQVKAGTDSSNAIVNTGFSASVTVTAHSEFVLSFSNLLINKDYEVYVVGEDDSDNLMAIPVKIIFTTLPLIKDQKLVPAVEIGQIITINITSLDVVTTKNFPDLFKMAVLPGDGYEIMQFGTKSFDIKISEVLDDMTRMVKVKVGDGIVVSDEFNYRLQVIQTNAQKQKPISYSVSINPLTRRSYLSI